MVLPFAALTVTLPAGAQDVEPLDVDVALALGISRGSVQELRVPPVLGDGFTVAVEIGDRTCVLEVAPRSVRADGFQLLEQRADAQLYEIDPGPVTTLRGTVLGEDASSVAGSLDEEGFSARIRLESGEVYWLQPLWKLVDFADPDEYVVYRSEDVFDTDRACGADLLPENWGYVAPTLGDTSLGSGISVAQLGCDADFQYFQRYGSTTAVSNRIQSVIGTMNDQYETEVGITHDITTIIVRTTSNNPYTSTDPETLLNQFRSEWIANQTGVVRDVAHLFTGKNLNGGVIGIAWLSVICNSSFGYGLVESDFNNNFASATDLSAHELGHNWSANHCTCQGTTMHPFIQTANTFHATLSRPPIINHRNSRTCLDDGAPEVFFVDGFESGDLLSGGWSWSNGNATVVTAAARTGSFGARLKRQTNIVKTISTVGYSSVELKYSRRTANFDTGERLRVEYWTGAAWVLIESTTSTAWADRTFVLPASAANNPSFKLRFRTNGNQTVERADIDNVQLTGTP